MQTRMGWLAAWGVAMTACSGADVVVTGTDAGRDAGTHVDARREVDAMAERDAGRDAASIETGADVVDASAPDALGDANEGSADAEVEREAATDARVEADAAACTGASADAGVEAGASSATVTGFATSELAYVTMRHKPGGIPTDRFLELVFSEASGACGRMLRNEEKARSRRLVIDILRTDFDHPDMLPTFFVPGTYPFHENVYMRDAGFLITLADADLVEIDDACKATYTRASAGEVTLTRVDEGHVAGSFRATFDDGGTVSGDFDAEICRDVELPVCAARCVP
jgi:hypothetical protein